MKERGQELEVKYSLLSDKAILEEMENGNVIIDPYSKENLNTSSYDVTLGEFFYREQHPENGQAVYSPWSESDVKRVWGDAQQAPIANEYFPSIHMQIPEGINKDDRVLLIRPGETILGHTREFIGGRNGITTMMKARSSMGRNFIEVCKCAGWGDVGYFNRWTMEITNNSQHYIIPLPVGRRIAQITFFRVGKTIDLDYSLTGKYQNTPSLEELQQNWNPEMMLPRMWKDREIEK